MSAPATLIGHRLAHYSVLEQIGAGGMGIVYRARDERLDRDVAIKVLPAGALAEQAARKRFRKEALALARLNHPNIETVHHFDTQDGVDFLVTEYIPGATLNERVEVGPLPEKDVARLGAQLAQGLASAHEAGVVHSDLKPNNLRVTPDGRLKILDFGLAKLSRPIHTATTESLSEYGGAGTLPYMSPEQLHGEPATKTSDIYATGIVLYEMATGQKPFREELSSRLINAILHEVPVAPRAHNSRISPELERIILKCLQKEPENRYQSAVELAVDLRNVWMPTSVSAFAIRGARSTKIFRRPIAFAIFGLLLILGALFALNVGGWRKRLLGHTTPAKIESLAVLPLRNLSGDSSQEYFADGMTEQLISALTQIHSLRVISLSSVIGYKNSHKPVPQIANDLSVEGIITGSVFRSGGRLRITVGLTRAAEEKNLWSQSYERDLNDVLRLQSEVAKAITQEIQTTLTSQERARLASTRPVNPEAYEAYLKGRFYWNRKGADTAKSLDYFRHAIETDPGYAPAYVGMADYYRAADDLPPAVAIAQAREYALKALQLDNRLAEAHASLALAKLYGEWDWLEAEKEFNRALELNPNQADAHSMYSAYLSVLGRSAEALAEIRRAQELDPLSVAMNTRAGFLFYFARQYDRAIEQCRKALDLDSSSSGAHDCLGSAYLGKGLYREAISECQMAVNLSGNAPGRAVNLARAYSGASRKTDARKVLKQLQMLSTHRYVSPYLLAMVYVALGEKDHAFDLLEKAYQSRSGPLIWLVAEPAFDNIRDDPRFTDLVRRIGLPQ